MTPSFAWLRPTPHEARIAIAALIAGAIGGGAIVHLAAVPRQQAPTPVYSVPVIPPVVAPSQATPTPMPTFAPSRPPKKIGPLKGKFRVQAWVSPGSMSGDARPTLYAQTKPGATCSAHVDYSTGYAPVSFSGEAQLVSKSGVAAWGWHEETIGNGGVAWVQCVKGSMEALARTTFRVTG